MNLNKSTPIRGGILYFSCHYEDAPKMAILMTGLTYHSEVQAFPLWLDGGDIIFPQFLKDFGLSIDDTWAAAFDDVEALETCASLLESIAWVDDVKVVVSTDDEIILDLSAPFITWSISEFHKAVFVDKLFHKVKV